MVITLWSPRPVDMPLATDHIVLMLFSILFGAFVQRPISRSVTLNGYAQDCSVLRGMQFFASPGRRRPKARADQRF